MHFVEDLSARTTSAGVAVTSRIRGGCAGAAAVTAGAVVIAVEVTAGVATVVVATAVVAIATVGVDPGKGDH